MRWQSGLVAFVVAAGMAWGDGALAQAEGTGALRLGVEMRDGTLLLGEAPAQTLNLHSASMGRVAIDLSTVDTVAMEPDRETGVVTFLNGDRVSGAVAAAAIRLRTGKGEVSLAVADIHRMTRITGPPLDLQAGLLAYFPFNGDARDESGHGNNAKVHGAVLVADRFGRVRCAYRFDGKDDYIEAPAGPAVRESRGSVTVSAWVCREKSDRLEYIVRQGDFSRGRYRFGVRLFAGAGATFNISTGGGRWFRAGRTGSVQPGRWYHLVGVYDAAARLLRLYVNGVPVAERLEAEMTQATEEPLLIGAEQYSGIKNLFCGVIDDVRLYGRALARSEVADLFVMEERQPAGPFAAAPPPVAPPRHWVIDRPSRQTIRTQRFPVVAIPPEAWTPDDAHRVVSRLHLQPDIQSAAVLRAMLDTLDSLLNSGAIDKETYDRHAASVKEQYGAAFRREGGLERGREVDPVYRRGRLDMLKALYESGAISKEVYEAETAKVSSAQAEKDPLEEYHGRMQVLTRLYHRGELDTATFLERHTPIWDQWYRALNILPNGDFEEVEDREAPERLVDLKGWDEGILGYGDIGYSQVTLDREVKHSGGQSLRFTCTKGPALISLLSAPFFCDRDDAVKVRCFVKAQGLKRGYTSRAAVINFVMPEGSPDLSPAARLHIPEGTYDWLRFELRLHTFGHVPEGKVLPCRLVIEFYGEGTLWVDDVVVVPTTRR